MSVTDDSKTAYGLSLTPTPSDDPNDPLNWTRGKKNTILLLLAVYSFLVNGALIGPSVYVNLLAQRFDKTTSEASQLVNNPNLLFGFGSLIFVPMYHKIGRRPTMLISIIIYCIGLLGCALSKSYGVLMGFRMVHGFGSSVCEALPAQAVADVFFLHERGKALGCGLSYNLFFWIEFGLGCVLFLATLAFFEETMYLEERQLTQPSDYGETKAGSIKDERQPSSECRESRLEESVTVPPRKTYLEQCRIFGKTDPNAPVFMMMIRSFTYLIVPPVFWVCSTYGMVIGLAGLAFTSTFPIIVASSPYSWPIENTGLVAISAFTGYLVAAGPFSTVPDRVSAWLTRKHNNIQEAEYRLWCLVVVFFVSPAALILYGYSAGNHLHWFGLVFAVGMFQFDSNNTGLCYTGAFFYLTYTLAYTMDSYEAKIPGMLIAMNLGKQSISFAFGYKVIDWVQAYGFIKVFAGIFCGTITINNLFVLVFLIFGKWSRRWLSTTSLSRMHRKSIE
ncbi:major facilitator superfamily domain-containing protein [Fusarium flagelliforme]|uniref:major facilitator superfamily domain-containing protein n=1 Tax=Fusarium flagelliforme TaxID=2675880 RepID=UPI001E8E9AA2|nr:major facilitator superfamily domain-containing protein [Fusarium flagelliforme]KAH7186259.1 major facilitator superfamily domain-containing protein [Fusarium flagelliforme]